MTLILNLARKFCSKVMDILITIIYLSILRIYDERLVQDQTESQGSTPIIRRDGKIPCLWTGLSDVVKGMKYSIQ